MVIDRVINVESEYRLSLASPHESRSMNLLAPQKKRTTVLRTIFRMTRGAFLLLAGISHLTVTREAFLAQVPTWLPIAGDFVMVGRL